MEPRDVLSLSYIFSPHLRQCLAGWPRLALNSPPSCLSLLRARTRRVHLHTQLDGHSLMIASHHLLFVPLCVLISLFSFILWCWGWNLGPCTGVCSTTELISSPSCFDKDTCPIGLELTHLRSLYLNFLLKDPIFKYSYILQYNTVLEVGP